MDFAIGTCTFISLLTSTFTRFWRTDFSLTTSDYLPADWNKNCCCGESDTSVRNNDVAWIFKKASGINRLDVTDMLN
jgi:hypothetical protein